MFDIRDLRPTVVPKSDQLNAEQLLSGPITVRITEVAVSNSAEQPVTIHYAGEDGRPYKPCKTMRKLLIYAWGQDGSQWVDKSLTLYNDPAVQFGGAAVGGIRISHLSDIDGALKVSLTATRGKKAMHIVKPLAMQKAPPPSLDSVLMLIESAETPDDMAAAKALAQKLTAEHDQTEALAAYRARLAALRATT